MAFGIEDTGQRLLVARRRFDDPNMAFSPHFSRVTPSFSDRQ
jgi:hypothetical protein